MPNRKPSAAPAVPPPADEAPAHPVAAIFPVVGIGASAGGLAAFEAFFSGLPADTDPNMAFVLVQHLAPDHKSILADLIRRYTRMPVFEAENGMVVQANCVYIIPPNRDMAFLNGALQLFEPSVPNGHRLPIDFLFHSLAQDQHERAICIVLSGTGSDGSQGLRDIKAGGGMVMAQSPATTEFDGMPRSAIATDMVDYELPPAEMASQLMAYLAHAFGRRISTEAPPVPTAANALKRIFILLRVQTGHDFSCYKPSTINRRVERRMAVHQIGSSEEYVRYLQQTPDEVNALFLDLLIGVTNFFRDSDAFKALEEHAIPRMFADKPAHGGVLRVWSTGCSTGQEAYSIAILLQEHMEHLKQTYKVQVFATDIDSRAITTARAGLYPASIAADISPERLARFFTIEAEGSAYRIHKNIRDMVIFSEQDVIKDPPFSRLDLVSCRNLMIYMGAELQKKLIPLFHYTLNPGGMLFLGTSETVGDFGNLFSALDSQSKLYQRKLDFHAVHRSSIDRSPPMTEQDASPRTPGKTIDPVQQSLRELTEHEMLKQVDLSGALVNREGDILYLYGRTGMFLEPTPGETTVNNILKMAREGLRRELTTALHKAAGNKELVRATRLRVKTNGHFTLVNLTVRPVAASAGKTPEVPLYMVILEEAAVTDEAPPNGLPSAPEHALPGAVHASGKTPDEGFDRLAASAMIAALNDELQANKEYLKAINEELETSNEELKSSNEEMQSINEELQSTNEELETSKEEMQSINEELSTVNAELQTKVVDLSRASNDMNNLLASTGIGTVFVDHQLRILRFTPTVTRIINLIPSDVGRPVAHTVSNLVGYTRLVEDAQGVLDTLIPKEVSVESTDGSFYAMRILPYRTIDNVIEGAVITFADITEMVRAKHALQKANEQMRLAVVVRDASDAITVQDLAGQILAWNPGAVRMYGWSETEALQMNVSQRIPPALRDKALNQVHQLSQAEILAPYLTQRLNQAGTTLAVSMTSTALINAAGQVYAIATTERGKASEPARSEEGQDDAHG